MAGKKIRGISLGTVLMLILTLVILVGAGYVLLRLSSGHTVDLSRLSAQIFSTETAAPTEAGNDAEGVSSEAPIPSPTAESAE